MVIMASHSTIAAPKLKLTASYNTALQEIGAYS